MRRRVKASLEHSESDPYGRRLRRGILFAAAFVSMATTGMPVSAAVADCPNEAIRELQGSTSLPACRAAEQVSPQDKNGYNAFASGVQTTPSGESLSYFAPRQASFPGSQGNLLNVYRAERDGNGWSTTPLTPATTSPSPSALKLNTPEPFAFSTDLGRMVFQTLDGFDPSDTNGPGPTAPGTWYDLYRQEVGGSLAWISRGTTSTLGFEHAVEFQGATPDLGFVVFSSQDSLDPAHPVSPGGAPLGTGYLYLSDGSTPRLVGVLPDGSPDSSGPLLGDWWDTTSGFQQGAISPDGSRVVFKGNFQPEPPLNINRYGQLYLRTGNETRLVSKSAVDQSPASTDVSYRGAVWGGGSTEETIYFTTSSQLTADAPVSGGLYSYSVAHDVVSFVVPTGAVSASCLEPLPNVCSDVVATADDGSRVYFTSSEALASGSISGRPNLYVHDVQSGVTSLVGVLLGNQVPTQATTVDGPASGMLGRYRFSRPANQQAQITPGPGRYLVFVTSAPLTGFNNDSPECNVLAGKGCSEVFRYDAVTQSLKCISCGALPVAANSWLGNPRDDNDLRTGIGLQPPRYITDDGQTVFFNSGQGIVRGDTNQQSDAYEWHEDKITLLTGGTSATGSYFLTAGADGRDVFVNTRERLVAQDRDQLFDVYDLRAGGGLEGQSRGWERPCAEEACQDDPEAQPRIMGSGSTAYTGSGNTPGKRYKKCGKGKVRRKSRCVRRGKMRNGKGHARGDHGAAK